MSDQEEPKTHEERVKEAIDDVAAQRRATQDRQRQERPAHEPSPGETDEA